MLTNRGHLFLYCSVLASCTSAAYWQLQHGKGQHLCTFTSPGMETYLIMASVVIKVPCADSTSSISWAQVAPFGDGL